MLNSFEGDHSVVILYPHLLNVLKGFEAYIRILDGKVKHSVVKYICSCGAVEDVLWSVFVDNCTVAYFGQ